MTRLVFGGLLFLSFLSSAAGQLMPSAAAMAPDIVVGRRASAEFESQVRLVEDATVQQYVDGIGQKLARGANATLPVTVKAIDSNEVNAFSFPGGFLYINSALILEVDNEAEIASVLAHEMAHVIAHDGMRNVVGTGSALLNSLGLGFLGSSIEKDADRRAIRFMRMAGYNPVAVLRFLEKMQEKQKTKPAIVKLYETHPATTERMRLVLQRIGGSMSSYKADTGDTSELEKVKALLMKAAEKPS